MPGQVGPPQVCGLVHFKLMSLVGTFETWRSGSLRGNYIRFVAETLRRLARQARQSS
jgi:hypothetical protein